MTADAMIPAVTVDAKRARRPSRSRALDRRLAAHDAGASTRVPFGTQCHPA